MLQSLARRREISFLMARAYGSSAPSLRAPQKKTPPPKASAPKPMTFNHEANKIQESKIPPRRPQKASSPKPMTETNQKKQESPPKKSVKVSVRQKKAALAPPTSSWVEIKNIPPLSTLDDIMTSVNQVMDAQGEIVNLDAAWKSGGQVTLLERDPTEPWIKSARLLLSLNFRPNGWRIQFANRSVACAFLNYAKSNQFYCCWKLATVEEWKGQDSEDALVVSDSMIRVENVPYAVTTDSLRHIFRRFQMTRKGQSVRELAKDVSGRVCLIHFEDPSWARAAVREMQGYEACGDSLRLAQYPKQIL